MPALCPIPTPCPSIYLLGIANPEGYGVKVEESAAFRLQKERRGEAESLEVGLEKCQWRGVP